MRFEQLSVPAYGPFTAFDLQLPAGGSDFHLIYGPNEAGKSSLLRAIRDLLYGIHGQTTDNFRHAYKDLRIAGSIAASDGRRLRFQRRKGNKDTLLDADGQPLPDDALSVFLGNVDQDFFSSLFGLGAEELREGAEALLQGRGEVGQALFSASLAGTPVHRVLEQLDAEARAIFSGRSTKNVTLRPAVNAHGAHLQASRQASVRPEEWDEVLAVLAQAQDDRDQLDAKLNQLRARRDWLQRCLDALPTIGELGEQERRRAELTDMPDLGADFIDRTEQAIDERDQARTMLSQSVLKVEQLQARVRNNQPDTAVLGHAAEIEAAHQQLAVYKQWQNERIGLNADLARAETGLRAGMQSLGVDGAFDQVETLRTRVADELALREAAAALDATDAALRENALERERQERSLNKNSEQLAKLPAADVSALRAALAATASSVEAQRGRAGQQNARDEAWTRLVDQHALLRVGLDDQAATFGLPVPSAATLRRFESEAAAIEADRRQLEQAVRDAAEQCHARAVDLERLGRRGSLPSVAALAEARAVRDQAWARVLAAWQQGAEAGSLDGKPLAEAYPLTVTAADGIADALRDEADAVARAEELRVQLREAERAQADAQARLQALDAEHADWRARWAAAWCDCALEPRSPAEMLEWRDQWTEFRICYQTWRVAAEACDSADSAIGAAEALLAPLLSDHAESSLPALRDAATRRVREADKSEGARETLQNEATNIQADLDKLAAALPGLQQAADDARAAWKARCAALALAVDTSTVSALALLDQRKALVGGLDDWNGLRQAQTAKVQAIDAYADGVRTLADALSIAAGSVEVREQALWSALEQARALQTRQDQARADLTAESEQVSRLQATLAQVERRVADAVAASGSTDEPGLKTLLANLRLRRDIDAEIERLRKTLHAPARGESIDAFIERVRAEAADQLTAEHDTLDQDIPALERQRDDILKRLVEAEASKHRLEQSGAEAAEQLQAAQYQAAVIRQDAARYLRLQLAMHFLRAQIEQFRRQNQGPLLAKAGAVFSAITQGSFAGLATAYGADDVPVLVGVRNGEEIGVEGMSEGTRDQLYLALRLAAIDRHQQHHEPMPVVLDDLLITFDDHRASALLPILSDLGSRTQLLLFSHHRHLLDLARDALPADGVHFHNLPVAHP